MHGVQGRMLAEEGAKWSLMRTGGVLALSSNIMEDKPEHIMLDEEGVVARLENKVLHEGLWDVLVRLKLTKNVDEDSTIKHWLAVDCRDQVGNFLEGE